LGECYALTGDVDGELRRRLPVGLEQRDVLSPLALAAGEVAARLQPGRAELVNDVIDRLGLGRRIDAATLEIVGGNGLVDLRQAIRAEAPHRSGGYRRRSQGHRATRDPAEVLHRYLPIRCMKRDRP
jgi:hypothetical protein